MDAKKEHAMNARKIKKAMWKFIDSKLEISLGVDEISKACLAKIADAPLDERADMLKMYTLIIGLILTYEVTWGALEDAAKELIRA